MNLIHTLVFGLAAFAAFGVAAMAAGPRLTPVPFTDVHIADEFWQPRLEANRTRTLPHNLDTCEKTGRIANFARAAGRAEGKYEGRFYNDSDVYKVLEGAAYALAQQRDPALEARVDGIIDLIAAAQQPDGYINAYFTVMEPDKRWTNLFDMHELYCAGHMFEAAVAYAQATGKTKLLDVAVRMADHIDSVFGPDKRYGVPGHEEIELALIKLYRHTGEERYRKLAEYFIDARGKQKIPGEHKDPVYMQAHKPVREQTDIAGHAVRAMYLYAGVADVAAITGDPALIKTMDTIWHSVVDRKMYITGGVGARHGDEAFGEDYELPNDSGYCETCAAIGLALWNQRLLMMHADGRFADVIERVLYNGALPGVSLAGDTFFYVNPLSSNGKHHRQPWYGTACCPTNIVRFIPSIGGYIYATDEAGVWVNHYVAGTGKAKLKAGEVTLTQQTKYPWSGEIRIAVEPAEPTEFDVNLRIPGWWPTQPEIAVNGQRGSGPGVPVISGYAKLRRIWKPGDTIELSLPMEPVRMRADPRVAADRGRVALQRGPIVYCLEAVDNGGQVLNLVLPREAKLATEMKADLLGGVMVIRAEGVAATPIDWQGKLYQSAPPAKPAEITAIPYYAWDHRTAGEMTVWIPESAGLVDLPPSPSAP